MNDITRYLSAIGRKGARQRAKNLTAERKAEIAQMGAAARWKDKPAGKKKAAVQRRPAASETAAPKRKTSGVR